MESILPYLVLTVPALIALTASFFVKNRVAFWILRIGPVFYLCTAQIMLYLALDCRQDKFSFFGCRLVPDSVSHVLSLIHIISLLSYVSLAPALIVLAVGFEVYTRFKSR